MGLITGKGAAINGLPCLEKFQIVTTGLDNAVACSDSEGAVIQVASNIDWMGAAVGYGHTPPKLPGEKFTLTMVDREGMGWQSASNGTIVDRVKIFCPSGRSGLIYYHIFFSGSGILYRGEYTVPTNTLPTPAPAVQRGISVNGVAMSGIDDWTLEIEGNTSDPVWPADSLGWPHRSAGNISATINWNQLFDDTTTLLNVNDFRTFRLHVTDSAYWEVKYAKVTAIPGRYTVWNQENKTEYVNSPGEAVFSSVYGGVRGHILRPNGLAYWD